MIDIDEHARWEPARHLLLIGPGAAGKSSLGSELQTLMGRRLFDLDMEFLRRFGDIGVFIRDEGYQGYKLRNSLLAIEITTDADSPIILVTSSGFLTPDNPATVLERNKHLLADCYSICLLPSRDLEKAVEVIVQRQLARPFSDNRQREEEVIRYRYPLYAGLGDMTVFSTAPSSEIASAVASHLSSRA
jgi:shikimate kinase